MTVYSGILPKIKEDVLRRYLLKFHKQETDDTLQSESRTGSLDRNWHSTLVGRVPLKLLEQASRNLLTPRLLIQ